MHIPRMTFFLSQLTFLPGRPTLPRLPVSPRLPLGPLPPWTENEEIKWPHNPDPNICYSCTMIRLTIQSFEQALCIQLAMPLYVLFRLYLITACVVLGRCGQEPVLFWGVIVTVDYSIPEQNFLHNIIYSYDMQGYTLRVLENGR